VDSVADEDYKNWNAYFTINLQNFAVGTVAYARSRLTYLKEESNDIDTN